MRQTYAVTGWRADLERSGGSNQHNQKRRLEGGLGSQCEPKRPQLNCCLNRISFFLFVFFINSEEKKEKNSPNQIIWKRIWAILQKSHLVLISNCTQYVSDPDLTEKEKARFNRSCCSRCRKSDVGDLGCTNLTLVAPGDNNKHRGQQQQRRQSEEVLTRFEKPEHRQIIANWI